MWFCIVGVLVMFTVIGGGGTKKVSAVCVMNGCKCVSCWLRARVVAVS